jgi:hypothetical protein
MSILKIFGKKIEDYGQNGTKVDFEQIDNSTKIEELTNQESSEINQPRINAPINIPNENNGLIKVDIQSFIDANVSAIPSELFDEMQRLILRACKFMDIDKDLYQSILQKRAEMKKVDAQFTKTAELNNQGIAFEKNGDTDSAIKVYEENIALGLESTHPFDRLMILYRKRNDSNNEIRVIRRALDVFKNERYSNTTYDYNLRLKKLLGEHRPLNVQPIKAKPYDIEDIPLGIQYENIKMQFAEFDFYNSGENRSMSFPKNQNRHRLWEIQGTFKSIITEAKRKEDAGNFDEAAMIYERIIAEKYYLTTPYDRLIKIYSKAKLTNDERRVLKLAINHFTELKKHQTKYVLSLAKKYNKLDFAENQIANNKKITYYEGVFELYNPYPMIESWKKRLL